MTFLPNNPNSVNVAPSDNTVPVAGFWGERQVTWLKITGLYTYGGATAADTFEKPWSNEGYTQAVLKVLAARGTILGLYNDQPAPLGSSQPNATTTGSTLFVALGANAGYFTPGSITEGEIAAPGATVTITGTIPDPANPATATIAYVDPVSASIINDLLKDYVHTPASLEITVGHGFQVV